jgi:hypothetical protein
MMACQTHVSLNNVVTVVAVLLFVSSVLNKNSSFNIRASVKFRFFHYIDHVMLQFDD